jgi:uncharacterized protein YfkK (UPF0435 family)
MKKVVFPLLLSLMISFNLFAQDVVIKDDFKNIERIEFIPGKGYITETNSLGRSFHSDVKRTERYTFYNLKLELKGEAEFEIPNGFINNFYGFAAGKNYCVFLYTNPSKKSAILVSIDYKGNIIKSVNLPNSYNSNQTVFCGSHYTDAKVNTPCSDYFVIRTNNNGKELRLECYDFELNNIWTKKMTPSEGFNYIDIEPQAIAINDNAVLVKLQKVKTSGMPKLQSASQSLLCFELETGKKIFNTPIPPNQIFFDTKIFTTDSSGFVLVGSFATQPKFYDMENGSFTSFKDNADGYAIMEVNSGGEIFAQTRFSIPSLTKNSSETNGNIKIDEWRDFNSCCNIAEDGDKIHFVVEAINRPDKMNMASRKSVNSIYDFVLSRQNLKITETNVINSNCNDLRGAAMSFARGGTQDNYTSNMVAHSFQFITKSKFFYSEIESRGAMPKLFFKKLHEPSGKVNSVDLNFKGKGISAISEYNVLPAGNNSVMLYELYEVGIGNSKLVMYLVPLK